MEVAAGNADKSKLISPESKSPALAIGKARSVYLDRVQSLIGDLSEYDFSEIMGRMGQRGDSSSSLDQSDCQTAIQPRLVHARRATVPEETSEGLARTAHLSSPCKVIGKVAPTQAGAGEDATNCVKIDRKPQAVQPCGHGLDPLGSASAK